MQRHEWMSRNYHIWRWSTSSLSGILSEASQSVLWLCVARRVTVFLVLPLAITLSRPKVLFRGNCIFHIPVLFSRNDCPLSDSPTLISLSASTLNASNDWSVEGAASSGILPSTRSSSRRTHSTSSIASSQRPYDAVVDFLQSTSDASSVRTISTMSSTHL